MVSNEVEALEVLEPMINQLEDLMCQYSRISYADITNEFDRVRNTTILEIALNHLEEVYSNLNK